MSADISHFSNTPNRTRGRHSRARAKEKLGKKGRDTMSDICLVCCGKKIDVADLWILNDLKDYLKRKLLVGKCPVCGDDVALEITTRKDTNKTYFNLYNGIEAVKTLYREKKRKLAVFPDITTNALYGWIYGVNVQLKDKKGKVTKVRQYSKSLTGRDKTLVKEVIYR